MSDYKKFIIQQYTTNGSSETNVGNAVDTQATYGIVCKECPFKVLPEPKELPKRDWYDEHGDDVYLPSDGLKFKAYDLEVTFLYVGAGADKESDMRTKIGNFINFLYGRNDGGSPLLKIYDEYTLTGRKGVVCIGVDNDMLVYDDANDNVIGEFSVKFRVNNPVYSVQYNKNNGTLT